MNRRFATTNRRFRSSLVALAASALAGAGLGLAFQPYAIWPLTFISVAALTIIVRERSWKSAAWCGLVFGIGVDAVSISWVSVLGWWVGVLLVLAWAIWPMLVAVVISTTSRLPGAWAIAASAWTASEFAQSHLPFGGFPWLRLVWTTVDQPLSGWLPVVGAVGTSWVTAACAQGFATLVPRHLAATSADRNLPGSSRTPRRLLTIASLIAAAFAGGALLAARPVLTPTAASDLVNVGIVQGDVSGVAGPHALGYARSVTNNHLSETITLMARARTGLDPMPALVLWPENSTDIDPAIDPATAEMIRMASDLSERPILVGAVTQGPQAGERQTTTLWWTLQQSVAASYHKRNLVPFGEYIPLRSTLLPLLPILKQIGLQSVPGTTPGVVTGTLNDGRAISVGPIICFELAWDNTVSDTVKHGAQLVVVQSNNGTYTGTGQPQQQFAITRGRAMELRREVVVATTNSLSGLIDARGRVVAQSKEATAWSRTVTVPLRSGVTLGARLDPWLDWLSVVIVAFALGWAAVKVRQRVTPQSVAAPGQ